MGKKRTNESGKRDWDKEEEVLQALILADNFDTSFDPITRTIAKCLVPVLSVPIIEYVLDLLMFAGVNEVYVFCSSHPDQVKDFVKIKHDKYEINNMSISVLVSEDCLSIGDALREVDAKGIFRNDFILCHCDVISNINLLPIIKTHRKYRIEDKTSILTCIHCESDPSNYNYPLEDQHVIVRNTKTNRLHNFIPFSTIMKKVVIPCENILDVDELSIRLDLADTGIYICTNFVLQLFTDNFDYQNMQDFICGILMNEEILGNSIYMHLIKDEYGRRISNLHMYDAVSKDMIHRWVYPFVPDLHRDDDGNSEYTHQRKLVYIHKKGITLAKGSNIVSGSLISRGSTVGENCHIENSSIGSNCKIGSNVRLRNAYIWNNVNIGDGCEITGSLIAHDVVVKDNATVFANCVISSQVIIGSGIKLKAGSKLGSSKYTVDGLDSDWFDDEDTLRDGGGTGDSVDKSTPDLDVVGKDGFGYVYENDEEMGRDKDEIIRDSSRSWLQLLEENVDDDNEEDGESESDVEIEGLKETADYGNKLPVFYQEILDTLHRGYEEKVECDNLILEINASKYANNVTMTDVINYVTISALEVSVLMHGKESVSWTNVQAVISYFMPLLINYVKGETAQVEMLNTIMRFSVENPLFRPLIAKVIHHLYDKDILEEDNILTWHQAKAGGDVLKIKSMVQPFISWLQEAESEED